MFLLTIKAVLKGISFKKVMRMRKYAFENANPLVPPAEIFEALLGEF